MSTISTDEEDRKYQCTQQRLQGLQAKIVTYHAWAEELAIEIHELKKQKPYTPGEFSEQKEAIAFKERQINEIRSALNLIETRAAVVARILGITS